MSIISIILLSIILVGLCVFLLSFNIIFRKNGKFPNSEIGGNKELRKKGLMCAKGEEKILWKKKKSGSLNVKYDPLSGSGSSCSTCGTGCGEC
jgi:hypothetical protein